MTCGEVFKSKKIGDAPYFVFCDHASNYIPDDLKCLGLPDDLLDTHIAWDIGAGALATELGSLLDGTVFLCAFSRLIIDANRDPAANDIIPAVSDQIPIPGNQMLEEAVTRARIDRFHTPYHDGLNNALNDMISNAPIPFVISVHSFTNRLMGASDERPWPVGLLWREDEHHARAIIEYLSAETGWRIGDNQPYDAREFNYSVDRHVGPRNLPHITVEIRQDKIGDQDGVKKIAELLAKGVRTITR
jgi:predicted N-formylglutamate amidohydrolase